MATQFSIDRNNVKIDKQSDERLREQKFSFETNVNEGELKNNRLSISTCMSSISMDKQDSFLISKQQKKLFMEYLERNTKGGCVGKIIQKMDEHFHQLLQPTINHFFKYIGEHMISSTNSESHHQSLLYFAMIWLFSMGYKSKSHRNKFLSKIKISIERKSLYKAVEMYETMGGGILSREEQWKLIEGTCRNGWQFFHLKVLEIMKSKKL